MCSRNPGATFSQNQPSILVSCMSERSQYAKSSCDLHGYVNYTEGKKKKKKLWVDESSERVQ